MTSNVEFAKKHLIQFLTLLLLSCGVSGAWAAEAEAQPPVSQGLNAEEVQVLKSSLDELRTMAPSLRILLRTLRTQVGFDPREIQNIERGMSQSQQNLERLIAMHERNAFNPMRAHFMADELRRKSEGLRDSLSYVKRRINELDEAPGERKADEELKRNDDALMEQLGLYSDLVGATVAVLQGKGI